MTTRNLDALFRPKSIALIGASDQPGSVGQVLARNLLESGFQGPVMPVNPHSRTIRSAVAYRGVSALPHVPDLAVIATPSAVTPGLVAELGAAGCRAAVVISAGFEPATAGGKALRQSLLDAARPHLLRVLGPNCLGLITPSIGLNASFAHLTPKAGGLALVSQSGAIATAALDWAAGRGIGFSHVVSIGDAADIDVGDLLDCLALDSDTRAILLYVESISDARKFMSAGKIASRTKPVVVMKAGRSLAGAKAAFSHTGAMAGADAVYNAAFCRAGMLRADGLRELFDAAAILSSGLSTSGERLAILTNGGGAGVMAVDALDASGGQLAELSPATIEAVSRAASPNWSHRNPVDILGDAQPQTYGAALEAILADRGVDAVLVMNCPTAVTDSTAAARAVISVASAARGGRLKPILTCWLGDPAVAQARMAFSAASLPTHETPDEAVRAFMHLVRHRRNQQVMLQTPGPAAESPQRDLARTIVDRAIADGRTVLTDPEARDVLKAYGIPVLLSRTAASPAEASQAASDISGPVALKILSADISHKSDIGGVALDLSGPEDVQVAAERMLAKISAALPQARIDGFVVEPMVVRPHAQELIVGLAEDPTFGPTVMFGQGGVAAELIADRSIGLPPLDDVLAREMIQQTRVARLLGGYRSHPPADLAAIASVLTALGQMAADLPSVAELDINPLLADSAGVIAIDARIGLRGPGGVTRLAILPYPAQLRSEVTIGGERMVIRPVRPQDAPKLVRMVAACKPVDVRLRFGATMHTISPDLAARLSQIDYDRQMALVAEAPSGEILGVARLVADPEGATAEFSLMVLTDRQGRGLGSSLLSSLLAYAHQRGLKEVWGEVDYENGPMLALASEFGFTPHGPADEDGVRMTKRLEA